MALIVKVAEITKLDSKSDRFLTVYFRGVPHVTQVVKGCRGNVAFDEEFSWPLSSPIISEEFLEVRLFNKSAIFSDKLVAAYRCLLSSLKSNEQIQLTDNLVDTYNRSIESEITLELMYKHPDKRDAHEMHVAFEDEDQEVHQQVITNDFLDIPMNVVNSTRAPSIVTSTNTNSSYLSGVTNNYDERLNVTSCLDDKEGFHPRIRLPKSVSAKCCEWQVQVKIIEAKELNGMAIDPVVDISVGEQKKHTTTKPHNNNPMWDEFFVFEFKLTKEQILDQIIQLQVFTGRSIVSHGNLIGQFKMDLWTVFEQKDHSFFSKWAVLCGPEPTDVKGYLRVDVTVFGKGAHVKTPNQKQECDIEKNLLLPPGIHALRTSAKYSIKVYKARGIPRMISTLMANVKKAITGKVRDLADPYVEVSFAGCKGRTKTVKNSYEPEFNQEIIFWEFLPPMCRRIKIQLRDGDEAIGTHYLDLNDISNIHSSNQNDGFMPCFGPSWIHLYGSARDYSFFGENNELNEGTGEGMAYRGRVLIEISSSEYERCENGVVEVRDLNKASTDAISLQKERDFQLFACFFEASMIDRKVGERPVQFEMSIGEKGFYTEDSSKDTKSLKGSSEEIRLLADQQDGENDNFALTEPIKPVSQEKRYSHTPWDTRKPCLSLKLRLEDECKRHYYNNILQQLHHRLEDNLDELDERIRAGLPGAKRLIQKVLQEIISGCRILRQGGQEDGNNLDLELAILRQAEFDRVYKEATEKRKRIQDDNKAEIVKEMRQSFLKTMEKLIVEPHHGFPDIFIWMLCGGKRIAYTRIPAADVLWSEKDQECGQHCGTVQTLFMKHAGKRGSSNKGWTVQAKINVILWLGLEKHVKDMFKNIPKGFSLENEWKFPYQPIPRSIYYKEKHRFILRAHIYQARSLIASDESGLSDAFARVICSYKVRETHVVWKTRSPTWDQMLKFKDISFYGIAEEFFCSPPVVVIEIYDKDPDGENEFIGRALAMPAVKLANQRYERPFFPPVLQWFPIFRGDERAGDLLAAFELLEVTDDEFSNDLPYDPQPLENRTIPIPIEVKPETKKYRVEVLFWGVREMKRAKYLQVTRPRVELDCCYKITPIDMKTGELSKEQQQSIKSTICKNARINPNFDDPVVVFDVYLPVKDRYIPPITIRVTDCRAFGRQVLAGSYVLDTLRKYRQKPENYMNFIKGDQVSNGTRSQKLTQPNGHATRSGSVQVDISDPKSKMKKKIQKRQEDIIDWWTRFHVTMREPEKMDGATPDKEISGNRATKEEDKDVDKFKIYPYELEKVKEFNGFSDVVETFPLSKGKHFEDDDNDDNAVDCKRFCGKVKGCIRVWEIDTLPEEYKEPFDFRTTFKEQKRPKYDPVKVLVRVYCIRATELKPADPNGKADPYLYVMLGRNKVNDKKNCVRRQLNPEFGRMFEFEAELPFDNLLTIQVKDWDLMTMDDFIGETKIDIENRYYSKHRGRCGLPDTYNLYGCAKWRDSLRPTQILSQICKQEGIEPPIYNEGVCDVGGIKFSAVKEVSNERGTPMCSDEPSALKALRGFHKIPKVGFHLVPEHIETRPLYRSDKPGIKQGSLELWVDMFPIEGPSPGPPVDIAPRKPEEFELRIIVWNTDDIPAADTNTITGIPSSDIYLRGWLEGSIEDTQKTDVHYRSTDGNGMFHWRYVFPFMFHRAEGKFVTKKKATFFGVDEWLETHQPLLHIQVLDADVFSSDDLIGDLRLDLTKIPAPMKAAKLCSLEKFNSLENRNSLIKSKAMRGWWPVQGFDEKNVLAQRGEVELEFELLRKEEAELTPAGKGRDEPQALAKPNRPADSLNLFMSPLRMIQLLLCSHKKCIVKFLIVLLLVVLTGLFFYSMPGYTVKKIFRA